MSYLQNLSEALVEVEKNLADIGTGVNSPYGYEKKTGFLEYLFSPANPRTIQTEQNTTAAASKTRKVEIRYLPHDGDNNVVTSDSAASCDQVAMNRELIDTVSPTQYVEAKFTLDEEIIREGTLEGITSRLQSEFSNATRKIREQIDPTLFSAAATAMGTNPAQNAAAGTYTTLELLKADGTVSAEAFDQIKNDHMDNYMEGAVNLVGLGKARKYMNRLIVGGLNDGGVEIGDIMSEFGQVLFPDHFTTSSLGGADRVLALASGMQQFFNYSLYLGNDFGFDTRGFLTRGTIQDPKYPILYDYILKFDDNCTTNNGHQGAWTGRVFTYYDLWTVPTDAFGDVYGGLAGFNGITGYNITQAS